MKRKYTEIRIVTHEAILQTYAQEEQYMNSVNSIRKLFVLILQIFSNHEIKFA